MSLDAKTFSLQDCVSLTREQYTTLTELSSDPLFGRAIARGPYPSWESLLAGTPAPQRQKPLSWMVYHNWIGSLKFALLSREVENGRELYDRVSSIFERLLLEHLEGQRLGLPPLRRMKLVFHHVRGGLFHLRLEQHGRRYIGKRARVTSVELRRRVRVWAGEAAHSRRGTLWPKRCLTLHYHLLKMPLTVIEEDGVGKWTILGSGGVAHSACYSGLISAEISQKDLTEVSTGISSAVSQVFCCCLCWQSCAQLTLDVDGYCSVCLPALLS